MFPVMQISLIYLTSAGQFVLCQFLSVTQYALGKVTLPGTVHEDYQIYHQSIDTFVFHKTLSLLRESGT
jgi:hypothetical protein